MGLVFNRRFKKGNNGGVSHYYDIIFTNGAVKGMGQRMMLQTIEKCRALGFETISLNAAGRAGGGNLSGWKVWPRLGFTAYLTPEDIEKLPPELRGAKEVADLMLNDVGRAFWEKNGIGRHMDFDLNEKSYSGKKSEAVRQQLMQRENIKLK